MDDEKALLFIREEIDAIDSEIIALLESRLNLSLQIGKVKKNLDKNMHDDSREEEILKKIEELSLISKRGFKVYIRRDYENITKRSKK